jgi:zinc protease
MNNPDTLKRLGVSQVASAKGITEFRLDANGLKILLVPNHSAPVVTTMVLYRVGSRDEGAGFTGSTHFLEHLMFKGTTEHNSDKGNGLDDLLKPIGAVYNATTWFDRTNYFECAPREHLETCIMLEADRMRNLVLKQEDRDSEMTVVRNEFEIGENDPDDVLDKELWAVAFREHTYHWPTIGWRSEVEGVPMERLKQFYDTFYWPNNAVVLLVGDFEQDNALELIVKHFGKYTRSPHAIPTVYTVEPPQQGERRFEVRRGGDLPRVHTAFHIPNATHADIYPLAAMAAILGGTRRSSRLYKRLIDSGLASRAFAQNWELRDPGLFQVGATVAPDVKVEDVEAALLDEIAKLAAEPVTEAELERARKANRKSTVLQAADPLVWARMIGEAEASADWRWMVEYDDNFDKVTPADVQRVAQKYFSRDNRTVGIFIPKDDSEQSEPVSEPTAARIETEPKAEAATAPVKATFAAQVKRTVLKNGLTVLTMQNTGNDLVALSGKIRSGGYFGPADKHLVPELVSYMLTKGSSKYSKTQAAEVLEEMGTHFNFGTDNFATTFGVNVVREDLPKFLDLITDMLRNPLFAEEELKRSKKEFGSFIKQAMADTGKTARNRMSQELYPADSVYRDKPYEELLKELDAITVEDLKAFHATHYGPKSAIVSVVGNISSEEALKLVEQHFGTWTGGHDKPITVGASADPAASKRIDIAMPDKTSVDIVIALPAALKRSAPDFFAARLANAALGQDTLASRLGLVVREKHGLTYGIRSSFDDISFGGAPWMISLSTNPVNVEKALGLIKEVVDEYIANGITDRELADEAGRAAGTFLVQLRTSLGIAGVLTQFEFLGLNIASLDSYAADLKAVTKDQVNEAIRKYFRLDKAVTVLAGTFAK